MKGVELEERLYNTIELFIGDETSRDEIEQLKEYFEDVSVNDLIDRIVGF